MERILILLVVASAAFASRCPTGWDEFNAHCYAFGKGRVSFEAARDGCESLGAHLVEIDNPEESHFIDENMMKGADVWIGVTGEKDEWKLLSGTPLKFTNWVPSRSHTQSRSRMCVTSLHNDFGRWSETPCNKEHRFVCEKTPSMTPSTDKKQLAERMFPFWPNPWMYSGYFPQFFAPIPIYDFFPFPNYWPIIDEPSDKDVSEDIDHPIVDKKKKMDKVKPSKISKQANEVSETRQRRQAASGDGGVFLSGSKSSGSCAYGGCNGPRYPSSPYYPSSSSYPSSPYYPSSPSYSNYPSYSSYPSSPSYSRYPSYPSYGSYPTSSYNPYYNYQPYQPSYQPSYYRPNSYWKRDLSAVLDESTPIQTSADLPIEKADTSE